MSTTDAAKAQNRLRLHGRPVHHGEQKRVLHVQTTAQGSSQSIMGFCSTGSLFRAVYVLLYPCITLQQPGRPFHQGVKDTELFDHE